MALFAIIERGKNKTQKGWIAELFRKAFLFIQRLSKKCNSLLLFFRSRHCLNSCSPLHYKLLFQVQAPLFELHPIPSITANLSYFTWITLSFLQLVRRTFLVYFQNLKPPFYLMKDESVQTFYAFSLRWTVYDCCSGLWQPVPHLASSFALNPFLSHTNPFLMFTSYILTSNVT